MARDWGEIVKRLEGTYPQLIGGTSRDDTVRQLLVPYANDAMEEISRHQRWSYDYTSTTFITAQGVNTQTLPANYIQVRRCYWVDQNGRPQPLERWDRLELQRVYGDPVSGQTTNQSAPTKFSLDNNTIYLYPVPDFSGPTSGNYTVTIEGYTRILSIVETTGTSVAASPTLTVPSTVYLTDQGLLATPTGGPNLSVRSAGNLQFSGQNDTLVTSWSAFPSGTTVTMTANAVANQTAVQTFFNSTNWLITNWPDVLFYRVLCAVANYYGSQTDQGRYEGIYQDKLKSLRDYEFDRARGEEQQGVVQVGQRAPGLRRQDNMSFFDIRGGP